MRVTFGEARGKTTFEYRTINFEGDHGTLWGWIRLSGKGSALRREVDAYFKTVEKKLASVKRALERVASKKGWKIKVYGPDTAAVYGEKGGLRFDASLTVSQGTLKDAEKKDLHESLKGIMKKAGFARKPTFG